MNKHVLISAHNETEETTDKTGNKIALKVMANFNERNERGMKGVGTGDLSVSLTPETSPYLGTAG